MMMLVVRVLRRIIEFLMNNKYWGGFGSVLGIV